MLNGMAQALILFILEGYKHKDRQIIITCNRLNTEYQYQQLKTEELLVHRPVVNILQFIHIPHGQFTAVINL